MISKEQCCARRYGMSVRGRFLISLTPEDWYRRLGAVLVFPSMLNLSV